MHKKQDLVFLNMKTCSFCKLEKDVSFFGAKKTNPDGLQSRCKECRKIEYQKDIDKYHERFKNYYKENKEYLNARTKKWFSENKNYINEYYSLNKEKIKKIKKKSEIKNKEKIKERRTKYRVENKEKIKEYGKKYREENPKKIENYRQKNKDKIKEYYSNKRKTDVKYRLIANYRCRIKNYLKFNKCSVKTTTLEIVGLSSEELKIYIESKFLEGMTWENYGLHGWHIDHIIPLSSVKTEDEIIKLCHYTNLQPLWAKDNLSKHNKIIV